MEDQTMDRLAVIERAIAVVMSQMFSQEALQAQHGRAEKDAGGRMLSGVPPEAFPVSTQELALWMRLLRIALDFQEGRWLNRPLPPPDA